MPHHPEEPSEAAGLDASAQQAALREGKRLRDELRVRARAVRADSRRSVLLSQSTRAASAGLLAALHHAVTAYTLSLRGIRMPPEQALILVKDAVRDAAPSDPAEASRFHDSVITSFLEGYYVA